MTKCPQPAMLGIVGLIQLVAHPSAVVDLGPAEFRRVGFRIFENCHHVFVAADYPETNVVGRVPGRLVPPYGLIAAQPSEEIVWKSVRERTAIGEIDEFHQNFLASFA
jgi:hypothetical protein